MEPRKIIKFGNSSYVLTLPFDWINRNSLQKGDTVNLIEKNDSLIIFPDREKEPKRAEISIDNKPLKIFNKQLISYYLKNYRYIVIKGANVLEKLDEIKIFKEKLSSIEITEISKDHIVLKDLSSPDELNIERLISEIIEMEKILFDELVKTDSPNKAHFIAGIDSNVNKLTFLSYKAINYHLDSLNESEQVKHAIHYWRIVSAFETIGDIIKRMSRYLKNGNADYSEELAKIVENLKSYFIFITSLLNSKANFANNLKVCLDKKQSLLMQFEELKNDFEQDRNLLLLLIQLLKDIIGQLDEITLSVVDLNCN